MAIGPSGARIVIPEVAASETGPALNSALTYYCNRTCLEWPTTDGESPVGETIIYHHYSPIYGESTFGHVKSGRKNSKAQAMDWEDRLPRLHIFHDR